MDHLLETILEDLEREHEHDRSPRCLPERVLEALITNTLENPEAKTAHAHLRECLGCLHAYARLRRLLELCASGNLADEVAGSAVGRHFWERPVRFLRSVFARPIPAGLAVGTATAAVLLMWAAIPAPHLGTPKPPAISSTRVPSETPSEAARDERSAQGLARSEPLAPGSSSNEKAAVSEAPRGRNPASMAIPPTTTSPDPSSARVATTGPGGSPSEIIAFAHRDDAVSRTITGTVDAIRDATSHGVDAHVLTLRDSAGTSYVLVTSGLPAVQQGQSVEIRATFSRAGEPGLPLTYKGIAQDIMPTRLLAQARVDDPSQKGRVSARALYYDQDKMASVTTRQTQALKKAPAQQPVLALRVTVKLIGEAGGVKEVKPSSVFRSGDRIKLAFTSNKDGYLYLANIGSSGTPTVLIPGKFGPLVSLRPGFTYEYPSSTKVLRFDTQVGEEQIYALLSEVPLDIIDFGNGQQVQFPSSRPHKTGPETGRVVASVSAVQSRDLVVEEDNEALYASVTPGGQKETPPVVVKMTLTHRDAR